MTFIQMLLIDDDPEDCELFGMALASLKLPVSVKFVNSAGEALQLLKSARIVTEVMVVDLNMPKMTGDQFLQRKGRCHQLNHIPVYVLTTSSEAKVLDRARALGARAAFTKSNILTELKELIGSIIYNGITCRDWTLALVEKWGS